MYAKKLLMAFCAFAVAFGVMAVEFSYEFNSDGANTITLTGTVGAKPIGAFTIPTTYAGKIVTRVGEYAFENNDKITSVVIPGSVRVIARDAFDECRKLKSLTIQEGVTSIGDYAFGGCALEAIVIPSSLVDLDSGAFSQNPIREFSVAASNPRYVLSEDGKLLLDKIDERLVHCIANPGAVVIPEGIVTIGHGAFEIAAWTSISFPRALKCLESGSLDGDKASASELDFKGTSLRRVGPAAFFFSPKLRKIVFPETLKEIGEFAFAGCYALNEVFFNGPPPAIVGEMDVEVANVLYLIRREGGVIPEDHSVFMSADKYLKRVSILDGVTTYVPRSKGWDDIVASGTWQGRPIKFIDGEIPQGGDDDTADWTVAHNFSGVVYDAGENCVGMIQIATKKATKKGVGVSGTMMLQDGKKITLKNMTVAPEGGVLNVAWTVKGYGELNVAIGAEGFSGQFEDGGSVESQELDEDTGVLKASITMTYIDKKTGKMKTKKITFGGFVSGGEGVGTAQAGKKDPIKDVEFTVR